MAKKKIRFAVRADDGRHSSVWKIWVSKSDVYIQPRMMEDVCKISLHESGIFHWKAIPEFMASNPSHNGGNPYHAKWGLVEPIGFAACHVFRIVFPGSELRQFDFGKDNDVAWLDAPNNCEFLSVDCYLAKISRRLQLSQIPIECLFSYELSDGRLLFCIATIFKTTEFDLKQLALAKAAIAAKSMTLSSSARGVGMAVSEDHVVSMIEIAAD